MVRYQSRRTLYVSNATSLLRIYERLEGGLMASWTAITKSSPGFSSIAAFTAGGLLSGVLTAASLAFLEVLNPFIGAIFGAAIAIGISLRRRHWSTGRIAAFIASSVMAYSAASWSPIGAIYVLRTLVGIQDLSVPGILSPFMFSVAGFVGAFVTMLAVLILFFQERGWHVPARALLLALPGAFLGLLSAITSESIQNIASHWISPSISWGFKPEQFYSAYLIWQTGMAFAIAAFVPRKVTLALPEQSAPNRAITDEIVHWWEDICRLHAGRNHQLRIFRSS
jgi:glucan phosphoethanolaminetransferase (alkaline phosphatase superfamily)